MTAMIEVKDVSKAFGGVIANNKISLEVPEGRVTGLIGPNGSGKTTLFNSIVGYHPIDEGSIKFEGVEISKRSQEGYGTDKVPSQYILMFGIRVGKA